MLTFLSPIYLWLLPLIALPVIIHLLAKRKSKLIAFPSLKFLKLLEQDALRKFNVKQLLLLIIRTLMVLFVILAFSRPNFNARGGFSLNTQTHDLLIFALDNTASNQANFERLTGSWLEDFGADLAEKGYTIAYLGISDFELRDDPQEVTALSADIYVGNISMKLAEQIDLERYQQKSMVWLGDGQDVRDRLEELADWDKFLLLKPVTYDMGISQIELPDRGLRQGEEYQLQLGIDHAPDDEETTSIELIINGDRQNQTVIEADVDFIEMKARVLDPGFQDGSLQLGHDEHAYNDIRHFVIPAGGNVLVQILRERQVPDYWKIIETAVTKTEVNLDVRLLDFNTIDNMNLSQGGTVIVDDASKLDDYNWNRLQTFVATGGQLVLFGNGGTRMEALLNFEFPLTESKSTSPLGLYLTPEAGSQLRSDPLATVIAQDRLKVLKRYTTNAGELDQTWIRFLDNQPFLGATGFQEGRIVWFNTDFRSSVSNLPFLGIFPTLILQLCQSQELADLTARYNVEIGDTLHFFPLAQAGENTPFSIQRPDGTVDYQAPDSNYIIHYPATDLPGVYRLARGRQILEPIAVNISAHEAQAHSRNYRFDDLDLVVLDQQDVLVEEIMERRSSMALWPLLLIALLLLWVVETYLSRIKSTWRQNV